jgi:hypothetical protein
MGGYMLFKAEVEFYVPTSTPVTSFPFCDSETTCPQDIAMLTITATEIIRMTREDLSAACDFGPNQWQT